VARTPRRADTRSRIKKNGEKTEVTLADVVRSIEMLTRAVNDGFERQRKEIATALTRDRKFDARLSQLEVRVAKIQRKR
jgi:hypothetical protein